MNEPTEVLDEPRECATCCALGYIPVCCGLRDIDGRCCDEHDYKTCDDCDGEGFVW